jgi:hypothetical protein
VCPLRVFWVYNKVADSGDVVIEEQGFSIDDTRELAIAMPLSAVWDYNMDMDMDMDMDSQYKNRIFLVGRHQGVRRFGSPGLHHNTPVSSHWGYCVMRDIRRFCLVRSLRQLPIRKTFRMVEIDIRGRLGNGGDARAVLECGGEV